MRVTTKELMVHQEDDLIGVLDSGLRVEVDQVHMASRLADMALVHQLMNFIHPLDAHVRS